MRTLASVVISAPIARILPIAMETQRWPERLPHYRFVRTIGGEATRTVAMAAYRDCRIAGMRLRIPVRWRAIQENDPQVPEMRFRHIAGWTRGMEVWWRFVSEGTTTKVTIEHRLDSRIPVVGALFAEYVVGRFFIDAIAGHTLATVKQIAEADACTASR